MPYKSCYEPNGKMLTFALSQLSITSPIEHGAWSPRSSSAAFLIAIIHQHRSKMYAANIANKRHRRHRKKNNLSVDSPVFTPATLPVPSKGSTFTSQAAALASFTPRSAASGMHQLKVLGNSTDIGRHCYTYSTTRNRI